MVKAAWTAQIRVRFDLAIATLFSLSSCSVPLAFSAMMASTKGKDFAITVSICNWNNFSTRTQKPRGHGLMLPQFVSDLRGG